MRKITFDCTTLASAQLHQALAQALNFPSWYGSNLDALYDCLTELEEETHLVLKHLAHESFRTTLLDAARDNPLLRVELE